MENLSALYCVVEERHSRVDKPARAVRSEMPLPLDIYHKCGRGTVVSMAKPLAARPKSATGRGKVHVIADGIEISSCFDSGNLDRVEQCRTQFEYNLWTAPDCAGTPYENGNRTWFHFSVKIPDGTVNKIMKFHIQNMNRQSRLYQQRMVPIFRAVPGKCNWERLRDAVSWQIGDEGMILSFEYRIHHCHSHKVYFAFCYPFSYCECQKRLTYLDQKYGLGSNLIYYHRELLCYTLEGRRVDLLTISSMKGIRQSREPRLSGLFPDPATPRAHSFEGKKVFLVTSRVHPGETPSSHVLNGLLNFLMSEEDMRAEVVRDNFVIKVIPMLNPDGVAHGHYRTDTRGVNLNRMYLNPDPKLHPSIFAAKSVVLHHHQVSRKAKSNCLVDMESSCTANMERGGSARVKSVLCHNRQRSRTYPLDKYVHPEPLQRNSTFQSACQSSEQCQEDDSNKGGVAMYIDLHAHANKRGCFFYGNCFKEEQQQVENMLYPRLVALNTPHLDFEHCLFSEKSMSSFDKRDGTSKEGTGRVAMYKATGLVHCYTLECNYNSGRKTNGISSATCDDGRASPSMPYSPIPHTYNIASFKQVGHALAIALLDLHNLNPWSRLPTSETGSIAALRNSLALRIKASRTKARNGQLCSSSTSSAQSSLPLIKNPVRTHLKPELVCLPQEQSVVSRKKSSVPVSWKTSDLKHMHQIKEAQLHVNCFSDASMKKKMSIPNVLGDDLPECHHMAIKASSRKYGDRKQCLLPKRSSQSRDCHLNTPGRCTIGMSRYKVRSTNGTHPSKT